MGIALLTLSLCAAAGLGDDYQYIPYTDPWVAVSHGKNYSLGKLDAHGVFHPFPQSLDVPVGVLMFSSGAPGPVGVINARNVTAYEYRSGRLILGRFDKDGCFVPDLHSRVIAFADYRPGPKAIQIYNLPGYFVKRPRKDEGKKP